MIHAFRSARSRGNGGTYSTENIKKRPVLQGAKQNRKNEAGMWDRRGAYRFLVGKPEGRRPFEDLGVDGRIILKCILKKIRWERSVDWIDLAKDTKKLQVVVNAAINSRVPQNRDFCN
jgi:hypothetical protein